MKVYFESFGCKVNQYETEFMKKIFRQNGFDITGSPQSAHIIIINSCTVTASGDSKSLYALRKLRRDNPDAVTVLTGCLPQSSADGLSGKIPEADIITGTKNRTALPRLVTEFIDKKQRIFEVPQHSKDDPFEAMSCEEFSDKTRAFVKIQDGCDRFCSYCIIPYSRGRCRSKPLEDLKNEVEMLASKGHREIVLVGINLAFYGAEYGLRLADAVEVCCGINGVERVRLGSLEPEMISGDDLARLSRLKQFCPQFHLSLQSGCASTLRRMNRHYTPDEYLAIADRIRNVFPQCSLTTDVMVGFPQESDEEFEESLAFVEKVGFAKIHVFQYSIRNGTPAANMIQVPKEVKQVRADRMKALGAELQSEYLKKQVGKTVKVLFERESDPAFHQGYAPDYTLIKIPSENCKKSLRKSIFYVKIIGSENDFCTGKIIGNPAQKIPL